MNRHIPYERNPQLDAKFLISVYFFLKYCPSLLDITDVRAFPRNFRNFNPLLLIVKPF
jgi:hypothetical protein